MLTKGTPWQVALVRAVLSAVVVGAIAVVGVWSQTDDAKTLAIAGLTPALMVLATRFGAEGWIDTRTQ